MQIGMLGINHKSSELILREKVTRVMNFLFGGRHLHFFPKVFLSTCNRCEIYFSGDNLAEIHSSIINAIRYHTDVEFEHALYSFFGIDCFSQLLKVVSGFDSAIFSETEIQGQVKQAYAKSAEHRLSPELHYLFQKSFKVGKKIRSEGAFRCENLPEILWKKMLDHFADPAKKSILFIGASQINLKVARFFKMRSAKNLWLTNRTDTRGREIAKKEGLSFSPWNFLSLKNYDILFFATKSQNFLVTPLIQLPSLVFDLGVPRNVHPDVDTNLYNIDQVQVGDRPEKLSLDSFHKMAKREMERFLKKHEERKLLVS